MTITAKVIAHTRAAGAPDLITLQGGKMVARDTATPEQVRKYLSYNPSTGTFTRRIGTGKGAHIGAVAGQLTKAGYTTISVCGRRHFAHRLAFAYMLGRYPEGIVDHKNGLKSDNRWENLREASKADNAGNAKPHKDAAIPVKGVSFTQNGKYRAAIGIKGKQKHLGTFETLPEAAEAYSRAAQETFGQFARTQ